MKSFLNFATIFLLDKKSDQRKLFFVKQKKGAKEKTCNEKLQIASKKHYNAAILSNSCFNGFINSKKRGLF